MGLNIYYVASSIYGFWQWTRSKGRQEQTAEDIETAPQEVILYRNMTLRLFAGISFSIVALFALLYYVLHYFTDSPIPAGDAFTTAVGIVATWMLARRIVEMHHGRLALDQELDGFVTAAIELPTSASPFTTVETDIAQAQRYASDLARLMTRRSRPAGEDVAR